MASYAGALEGPGAEASRHVLALPIEQAVDAIRLAASGSTAWSFFEVTPSFRPGAAT